MQWSKLKKSIEGFLADSLKSHVQFHVTRYGPGQSDIMTRAWVTWDKQEVANFSTAKWMRECYGLAHQIQEINRCKDFRDPDQREEYYSAYQQAGEIVDKKGIFSRYDFYDSLEKYLELSIEEALQSENPIIRALSMFDRRLGKRRLRRIGEPKHPLVKQFYDLRCMAEGIEPQTVQ